MGKQIIETSKQSDLTLSKLKSLGIINGRDANSVPKQIELGLEIVEKAIKYLDEDTFRNVFELEKKIDLK